MNTNTALQTLLALSVATAIGCSSPTGPGTPDADGADRVDAARATDAADAADALDGTAESDGDATVPNDAPIDARSADVPGDVARDAVVATDAHAADVIVSDAGHVSGPSGTLDTGFGTAGVVRIAPAGDAGRAAAVFDGVAIDASDRIVTCGTMNGSALVARFTPSGALDATFGAGGLVVTHASVAGSTVGLSECYDLAVQPDGRIVGVGVARSTGEAAVAFRLRDDGTLDPTFGTAGTAFVPLPTGYVDGALLSVALAPDGAIVAAGGAVMTSQNDSLVARLLANGTPDATFGTAGVTIVPVSAGGNVLTELTLLSDGRIVAVGWAHAGPATAGLDSSFLLLRFDTHGALDTAFGEAMHDFGAAASEASGLVVQADGRIVATGYGSTDTTTDPMHFAFVRFGTDGRWDVSYGATLLPSTGPRSLWYQSHASAVQADGRVVSVGQRQDVSTAALPTDFALARVDADGAPDARFPGASAVATFDLGTPTDIARDVAIQQAGLLVLVGQSGPDAVVVRVNP